jgi:Fructose-2,6-bisphosphatase
MIISSPFLRATMTAEIINEYHNVPIKTESDFRERSAGGVDEKTWHRYFDMNTNLRPKNKGGETVKEFFDRVYKALDKMKETYTDETIVITAHGGVNHAFHAYFNNLPWEGNIRIDKIHNADIREYYL